MPKLVNNSQIEKNIRVFTNEDREYTTLLGGIGTGCISLGSRGNIQDWEIFNKQNKGGAYPYSHFALFTKFQGDEKGEVRILESRLTPPYNHLRPNGYPSHEYANMPRFESSKIFNQGPFVNLELFDSKLPLEVKMVAFSPMIPTDEDNSGIPAIHFEYIIKNLSDKDCEVSVCETQANYTSIKFISQFSDIVVDKDLYNEEFSDGDIKGIKFLSKEDPNSRHFGTMCIATNAKNPSIKSEWVKGGWFDASQDFFDDFSDDGLLRSGSENIANANNPLEHFVRVRVGSIAIKEALKPGEEKHFEFVLSWSFPNRPYSWEGHIAKHRDFGNEIIKNHYAYRFPTADVAALYLFNNYDFLYENSKKFADALFSTSFDKYVVDAINGTMTVLRSPTCFRVGEEDTFLGWEGCFNFSGSCEGNCTHVWNYAQMVAFLFPKLEMSMIKTAFLIETDDTGNMAFRTMQTLGDEKWNMIPATDGQMGCVIRLYRDWKFSGNNEFLKECYPKMKKALDFAFEYWDVDKDFVIESRQHNTYDIEFYGPNSLTNSLFYAALRAGEQMALFMGDVESANKYKQAYTIGSQRMDKMLYKNGYYVQSLRDINEYKYQYGEGCLSDQIFGQTLAHINNLGYIFPKEHIQSSVKAIFDNNYRYDFFKHMSVQRTYALNDDHGLLLCSWPNGTERPKQPFVYSDEVWTGIEYQVATELVYEGYEKEALTIVEGIRKHRYDGVKRSPNNEIECGHHYARSLASYGLLVALSGFQFDMTKKEISFADRKEEYTTFFTTPHGFGLAKVSNGLIEVDKLYGNFDDINIFVR